MGRKTKPDELEQSFLRMNASIETIVHTLNTSQDAEDLFGTLIAAEFKKNDPQQRDKIKTDILKIIYS